MVFSWYLTTPVGLTKALSIIVWHRRLLLCPFHKKLIICDKKSLKICQTYNTRFSFIMYAYCYRTVLPVYRPTWRELTWRNLEVMKLVSYVSQQRGSPWIDAFGIFHNDSCLLELRGSMVLRGYCTPDQFLDCLCIFIKNYNTLVTSKICFL